MAAISKKIGDIGEDIACEFLESKGYTTIARNFRAAKFEIDIISLKDEYIVFTEVKTRKTKIFGSALQAVGSEKQKNIIKAAEMFLIANGDTYDNIQPRFDVVEVYMDAKTGKNYVSHVKFAFIVQFRT